MNQSYEPNRCPTFNFSGRPTLELVVARRFNIAFFSSRTSSPSIIHRLKVNMATTNVDEGIVTRLASQDKVVWYRKPNLRYLYFMLIPTCMGIQITSGFHSQMVNAMQILPSWINRKSHLQSPTRKRVHVPTARLY